MTETDKLKEQKEELLYKIKIDKLNKALEKFYTKDMEKELINLFEISNEVKLYKINSYIKDGMLIIYLESFCNDGWYYHSKIIKENKELYVTNWAVTLYRKTNIPLSVSYELMMKINRVFKKTNRS